MKSFFMIKLLIYMASLYRGVQINLGKGLALCLLGVVCIVSVMCKVINVKTDGSSIFLIELSVVLLSASYHSRKGKRCGFLKD